MNNYIKVVLTGFLFLIPHMLWGQDGWQPLFNGEDLQGWTRLGGQANYTVEDGAIIGEAVPGEPNSFLVTEQAYGDFILEFEVYLDTQMNSGVQIRSKSTPSYRNGRVHGYQVEIDPSAKAWSGGIYDEGRRGGYRLYNHQAMRLWGREYEPGWEPKV